MEKAKDERFDWRQSLKDDTFDNDAMERNRDEIVSRAIKLPDDDAIKRYVSDKFAQKVKFIQEECGEPDFNGQEYMFAEEHWFERVKAMLAEPYLMDVSKYAELEVNSETLGTWVYEKMTFDGKGKAGTRRCLFDLTDAIKADLADLMKENEGIEPTDRHYIKKVWFAGLRVVGPFAMVTYTIIDDGRMAHGKLRRLHQDAKTGVWELRDLWQSEIETTVAW